MEMRLYVGIDKKVQCHMPSSIILATYNHLLATINVHRLATVAASTDACPWHDGEGGRLMARLVDPTSCLIVSGATLLFLMVIHKSLTYSGSVSYVVKVVLS
ncbi:hypothetical protein GUJ93_ZPchr0010g8746 [Zizania palustris]|uniref:Uncharacterized protein n=1 Tax=Zizania palustris TaxID=103762 RepID=A0A8J5TBV3_ZIZPA|nr:hypothetical protein GUJ93_ZPchr0010g8746 [Zizania palustris]